MKRLFCLTAALWALACTALPARAAAPLTPPERAELLGRLQALHAKYPSFQAAFSEQRTSRLLKKPIVSAGSIAFQIPNKFRREMTGSNPSLTVSNGKELWIYYPNFLEAEQYTLGKRAIFDDALAALTAGLNFAHVEEFYQLEVTPETDGGYEIILTPKRTNLKRIVARLAVYLDKSLDVRRTDLTLPKGDQVVTTYSAQKRDAVPAATFEFAPPAGANVTHPLGK
ncbi:MAG: outer membrane lipoprotein carrier protein LolA [Chthoniobacteraceae bacterium]|nr:outer membrane lipoprotein carrier protein LolA [Chthoniobacteraceae bacterium]